MIRLAVRVAREHAELVLAELMVLAPGGLEEREDGETIEYVLYGAAGELPALGDVQAAVGGRARRRVAPPSCPTSTGAASTSRSTYLACVCDRRGGSALPGALDVVIEPGQAFGTGAHATTRLTLELLTAIEPEGALADWGCGSGVLAIAAAKLGWSPGARLRRRARVGRRRPARAPPPTAWRLR